MNATGCDEDLVIDVLKQCNGDVNEAAISLCESELWSKGQCELCFVFVCGASISTARPARRSIPSSDHEERPKEAGWWAGKNVNLF